jgi:hypothetical protein
LISLNEGHCATRRNKPARGHDALHRFDA